MAELHHKCEDTGNQTALLTWNWTGVPTDDSAPGSDGYYVQVVVDEGPEVGVVLYELAGAEDNAWGVDYEVLVPIDTGIYMQVINNADSFWFEHDEVVTCVSTETSSVQYTELPYTGAADWLLPIAVVLVAVGSWLARLGRKVT